MPEKKGHSPLGKGAILLSDRFIDGWCDTGARRERGAALPLVQRRCNVCYVQRIFHTGLIDSIPATGSNSLIHMCIEFPGVCG